MLEVRHSTASKWCSRRHCMLSEPPSVPSQTKRFGRWCPAKIPEKESDSFWDWLFLLWQRDLCYLIQAWADRCRDVALLLMHWFSFVCFLLFFFCHSAQSRSGGDVSPPSSERHTVREIFTCLLFFFFFLKDVRHCRKQKKTCQVSYSEHVAFHFFMTLGTRVSSLVGTKKKLGLSYWRLHSISGEFKKKKQFNLFF